MLKNSAHYFYGMSYAQRLIPYLENIETILKIVLLIVIAYIALQVVGVISQQPPTHESVSAVMKILSDSTPYVILTVTAILAVSLLGEFLERLARKLNEKIIGLVTVYDGKLTLSEIASKLNLKESELESIISIISTREKYNIKIDKDTKIVSVAPIEPSFGIYGTKSDKLKKLEALYKEGKIPEKTYEVLKQKYSEEE
jgi:hypothetical protein